MGAQGRVDHRHVRLGSSYQEMHRQRIILAGSADQFRSMRAVRILPVARRLLHIGSRQPFQDLGVRAFIIIALK